MESGLSFILLDDSGFLSSIKFSGHNGLNSGLQEVQILAHNFGNKQFGQF